MISAVNTYVREGGAVNIVLINVSINTTAHKDSRRARYAETQKIGASGSFDISGRMPEGVKYVSAIVDLLPSFSSCAGCRQMQMILVTLTSKKYKLVSRYRPTSHESSEQVVGRG